MSARIVCSGTRPSEYISERLISVPASRPPHCTFTPCAPERIAEAIERFIARRKLTRFSSCSAIDCATSFAQLGPLDLVDVDVHVLVSHRVDLAPQRIHLDAGLADHDSGSGGVDVDRDPLLVLADQDVGDARVP